MTGRSPSPEDCSHGDHRGCSHPDYCEGSDCETCEQKRGAPPAYTARTRLALALDLERALHGLADHLPGEPPAIIAWGPGELAQAVADAMTAPARVSSSEGGAADA